ncbi:MAG: GGDEF domain-containing protein [Candidatus Cloacimonetes bacterium]|nr:GGDEF domain-containing protein [Candidatus Cloacimonadota bacterium]
MSDTKNMQKNLLIWSKNLVLSGDKFNAMASAINFILEKVDGLNDCHIRLAYKETDLFGESSFSHFEIRPGMKEGVPFVELGGETQLINHFSSPEAPKMDHGVGELKTRFLIEADTLEILVCDFQDIVAWIRFENAVLGEETRARMDVIDDFIQLLGITLRNITNDFQLLLTKKQIEKQKRELEKNQKIIERQNLIFRALMETMTQFHQSEMKDMILTVMQQLKKLFPDNGFGMIILGERPEMIDMAEFLGVDFNLQQEVIQAASAGMTQSNVFQFYPLIGVKREALGQLVLTGKNPAEEDKSIIRLFLDQVASFMENKILMRELERMASTDGLTGAFNRSYFDRELEKSIVNAKKFKHLHYALIVLDLNGLKRVNDVFGHTRGDAMIVKSAEMLLSIGRKSDVVSRFGGDEFVILCPSTSLEQSKVLLTRIREQEAGLNMRLRHPNGKVEEVPIHFSIGIASTSEGIDPEEIMSKADERMYLDKHEYYETRERYR